MWCYKHSQGEITDKIHVLIVDYALSSSTGTFNIWMKKQYMNSSFSSYFTVSLGIQHFPPQTSSFNFVSMNRVVLCCLLSSASYLFLSQASLIWGPHLSLVTISDIHWQIDHVKPLGLSYSGVQSHLEQVTPPWQVLSIQVVLRWSIETFQNPSKVQFT